MKVSRLAEVCRRFTKGEPLDPTYSWLSGRSGFTQFFASEAGCEIPTLLKSKGLFVQPLRPNGAFARRLQRLKESVFEIMQKQVDASERAAWLELTRDLWQYNGEPTDWERARRMASDKEAESFVLAQQEATIFDALKRRDASPFIKLGKDLQALRRSRRDRPKEPLPIRKELGFLLANWNRSFDVDVDAGGRKTWFPPLCVFSDSALTALGDRLGIKGCYDKLVTRKLKLKRMPLLVRSVNATGKIVCLD